MAMQKFKINDPVYQNALQHWLVKEVESHPLTDDNVDFFGDFNVFGPAVQHFNDVSIIVQLDNLGKLKSKHDWFQYCTQHSI